MKITTVGECLHWSYANLAMAHAAVEAKAERLVREELAALLKEFRKVDEELFPL